MSRLILPLLFGLALGLAAGLAYAWQMDPTRGQGVSPAELGPADQAEYIYLAAAAYAADGNLERAVRRLQAAGLKDPIRSVTAMAQQQAAAGVAPERIRRLALLAARLGSRPVAASPAPTAAPVVVNTPASAAPTESPPPAPSASPFTPPADTPVAPTAPASPTSAPGYALASREPVCDPAVRLPLLQVEVAHADGSPVPGMEVMVEWADGFDRFFTGLKPDHGPGYGDFLMTRGVSYSVRLGAAPSLVVGSLAASDCTSNVDQSFPGGWRLVFRAP